MLCSKGDPKVSVGIPFYNAEATLADAIRSVFAQTFQDWELILVDDGSTDGSLEIARRVRDPRVRVLSDGANRQLSYRLNQIASEARGPLLARMDADDLMHPQRLAMQINFMTENPETDVLGSSAYLLDGHDKVVGVFGNGNLRPSRFQLFMGNFFVHPTVMMRTEWARQNPYHTEYVRAEDAELWFRTFPRSKFTNLADSLYYYRKESAFSFPKYAMSQRTARKIFRTYGSSLVGSGLTVLLLARSLGKSFIFSVGTPLGVHRWMFMFRHLRITRSGKTLAEEALASLKRVRIPGLISAGFIAPNANITLPRPCAQSHCIVRSLPEGVDPGYPDCDNAYSPSQAYPEYPFRELARNANPIYDLVRECFRDARTDPENEGSTRWNPLGSWIHKGQRVFILPNFVTHRRPDESKNDFLSKCTHPSVLRALTDYVYIATGNLNHISIGNASVQSCDYQRLLKENGVSLALDFYRPTGKGNLSLCDLRLDKSRWSWLGALLDRQVGSDEDAVQIDLGKQSLLEDLFRQRPSGVRVGDYDSTDTMSYHAPGKHVYVMNRRILESDVIFSVPKLKTHKLVGLTCALKGTVGSIARKECLAHYRKYGPGSNGDEYSSNSIMLKYISDFVDYSNRRGVNLYDNCCRIISRLLKGTFKINPRGIMDGAWFGNDTAWRMALDIARILRFARPDGSISTKPQRQHIALIDGIIAGEGEGPLRPKSHPLGVLVFSPDPCLADYACALLAGYDPLKIPLIFNSFKLSSMPLTDVAFEDAAMMVNGRQIRMGEAHFETYLKPPKGWRGWV